MSHLVYAYLDVDLERKKIEIEIVQIPGQNTPYRIVSVGGVRAGIRICSDAVCSIVFALDEDAVVGIRNRSVDYWPRNSKRQA